MQRTRVKICGITRVEDIQACAELGVDALGFVFVESSPRCVSVEQAAELIANVPPFIQTVGLFMDQSPKFVASVLRAVPLNLLQFHGNENPVDCEMHNADYIKAIPMGGAQEEQVDPVEYAGRYSKSKGFLLDSHKLGESGGSGGTFDWSKVPGNIGKPLILAGGLNIDNVETAVAQVRPFAVDVSSGVEAAKGIKDREKIAAFMKGVKQGDNRTN
ncbi:MAG: phosphoribosylanthranilate isomerase [Gammaproteobacteria bacterium]|nr:phosphoribosylanthranilate isomerase [Gammaproteobacteria bacterium]